MQACEDNPGPCLGGKRSQVVLLYAEHVVTRHRLGRLMVAELQGDGLLIGLTLCEHTGDDFAMTLLKIA